jgi:hypothetical protein
MVRRVLVAAVMVMVALSMVWAGGSSEKNATTSGSSSSESVKLLPKSWETFKDKPITLTAYWDVPRDFSDMHLNALVPKQILKDTGVTLDIKTAVDGTEQSLNLLIASNEWPDFMYVYYERPAAHSLVDGGLVYSYEDLAKQYGVDLTKRLNVNQQFVQRTQFNSQDIYFLNQSGIPPAHWNDSNVIKWQDGVFVNKNYYDQLGRPPINSMQDFINVAIRAKKEIPGVQYPVDVMRFAANRKGLFGEPMEVDRMRQFYGLTDGSNFNNNQGTNYKFYFQTDAFVQELKDLNQMWNAGLLAPDTWTAQSGSEKLKYFYSGSGMFDMINSADNIVSTDQAMQANNPNFSVEMLPNFDAVPGKYSFSAADYLGIGETRGFTIPKGAKSPVRALAFLDYLFSDDFQLMDIYGIAGQNYNMVNGVPHYTAAFQKTLDGLSGSQRAAQFAFNYLDGDLRDGYWALVQRQQSMPPMGAALTGPLASTIKKFKDITLVPAAQIAPYPANSEELKIYSNIKEVFGDAVAKIVVGPPADVESSYKALLTQVQKMGLDKLDAYQGNYIKNFAALVAKYGGGS